MAAPTPFDAIVLGAGGAGLMCAAVAGQRGRRIPGGEHDGGPVVPAGAPVEDPAEMSRAAGDAEPARVTQNALPARMTGVKRPDLERMRTLLGCTPQVSLREGVARVCARVRERLDLAGVRRWDSAA